jgi:uncharacterized protein
LSSDPYFPSGLPSPVPEPDGLSAPFWRGLIDGKIVLQRCSRCRTWQWGPEWICHQCHSLDVGWEEVEPHGEIYTATRVWHPVNSILSRAVPYWLVIVAVPSAGHVRLAGNLLGDPMQDVRIGARVDAQFEHHPDGTPPHTLLQWKLA